MKISFSLTWKILIVLSVVLITGFLFKTPSGQKRLVCKLNVNKIFSENPYEPITVSLFDPSDSKKEIMKGELNDKTWEVTFTNLSMPVVNISFHNYAKVHGKSVQGIDTFITNIRLSDSLTVFSLDYPFLSQYSCPICHRYDQVIPIQYGIGVPSKIGTKILNVDYIDGGCSVTNLWFCKRDSISF